MNRSNFVVDFSRREVGGISSRSFSNRFSSSENMVLRLELDQKLVKHEDCVNTLSFNVKGDILISGSDDKRVILWDWQLGNVKLSFDSEQFNHIYQAKFMPFSDDRTIVTCGGDGMVRRASILESGKVETSYLGMHQGPAHKLCIEPENPYVFYTSGEDGLVQRFDLRTQYPTEHFTCRFVNDSWKTNMEAIRLNAMAIDPRNPNLFAVGGMDKYAHLYDIRRLQSINGFSRAVYHFCPQHLFCLRGVEITGLAFSEQSELLVSYTNESIYLFTSDMGLGSNLITSSYRKHSVPLVYKGHMNIETIRGVNFCGPRSEYVVSGSDCGHIFIWRKKDAELIRVLDADTNIVTSIEPHPHSPVLASCGIERDIKVWTPKAVERATLPVNLELLKRRTGVTWSYFHSFQNNEEDLYVSGENEEEDESSDVDVHQFHCFEITETE